MSGTMTWYLPCNMLISSSKLHVVYFWTFKIDVPEITLPTRFSHRTGTLIDNFLCKLSEISLKSKSGILVDRFSDHQPYFMSINLRTVNIIPHRYITINKQTPIAIQNFKEVVMWMWNPIPTIIMMYYTT